MSAHFADADGEAAFDFLYAVFELGFGDAFVTQDLTGAELGVAGVNGGGGDGVALVGAGLEDLALQGAVEQFAGVEVGAVGDPANGADELLEFVVEGDAVERGVAVVGRLHGEFAHALEVVADGAERAFGGLHHGDAVVGVADGLGVAFDHRGHAIRDGESGGVVFGAVDAQPRGEPLQALGEGVVGFSQVVLRVE